MFVFLSDEVDPFVFYKPYYNYFRKNFTLHVSLTFSFRRPQKGPADYYVPRRLCRQVGRSRSLSTESLDGKEHPDLGFSGPAPPKW